MSFETLADKFNASAENIYKRFSPSTQQPVVIKPNTDGVFGSKSRIKDDNRALPVVSTVRDTRRVSKFLTSPEGVLFLAKQSLLQTGNTFASTRIYDPTSPLKNTIPFVHAKRFRTVYGLSLPGVLQNKTVETIASQFQINGIVTSIPIRGGNPIKTGISLLSTYLQGQVRSSIRSVLPQTYDNRPEFKVFTDVTGPILFLPQLPENRGQQRLQFSSQTRPLLLSTARATINTLAIGGLKRLLPKSIRNITNVSNTVVQKLGREFPTSLVEAAKQFRQNFYNTNSSENRLKSKYFNERNVDNSDLYVGTDPTKLTLQKGKTELSDELNLRNIYKKSTDTIDYNYLNQNTLGPDIINFIFSTDNPNIDVQFRALLSSIKENVKPEFNEQRYIGRIERFVTYAGVKRSVSLNFNVVAFSPSEMDAVWTKINYLTGLTFPKTVSDSGFMVPPLFRITVGGIYENQPCYVETLDYDFLDEGITYDVDKQVPFAVAVSMQLSLFEKTTRFHDSPFYKITQNLPQDRNINPDLSQIKLGVESTTSIPRFGTSPTSRVNRVSTTSALTTSLFG